MATHIILEETKSYKTYENAVKAVEKKIPAENRTDLRYFISTHKDTGRFFPVFIGQEALQAGVHFHFHVVG